MLENSKAFSAFSVDDIPKAKQFYHDVLGLTVAERDMGIIELRIESNTPIIIYPKPDHRPASFTILNFPVADIVKTVDQLIEKGVTFEQYDGDLKTDEKGICWGPDNDQEGPNIAWFKDPAGNILSVIEERK